MYYIIKPTTPQTNPNPESNMKVSDFPHTVALASAKLDELIAELGKTAEPIRAKIRTLNIFPADIALTVTWKEGTPEGLKKIFKKLANAKLKKFDLEQLEFFDESAETAVLNCLFSLAE
jgi:hypothetical protein